MRRKGDAVDFALAHIRASSGSTPDAASFSRCLASGVLEPASSIALETHLREAHREELVELVAQKAATFESLAALASQLIESDHPNATFLKNTLA